MEVLTLPTAALPAAITPVAPEGAEGAVASVDFSALLGTAQVAPVTPAGVMPPVAALAVATPAPVTETAVATPAADAPATPVDPAAIAAPVILAPVESARIVEADVPADPAAAAVVAGVNLPTLPKDFVAQKPPRATKAAAESESDDEQADETPDAPEVPQAAACVAIAVAMPVDTAPAAKPEAPSPKIEAQAVDSDVPAPMPVIEQAAPPAPKPEAAPQAQQVAAPVVADALAAVLPGRRNEAPARPPAEDKITAPVERAAPAVTPVAVDPLAAPAAPTVPQAQQSAPLQPSLAATTSVVLDDLFVAGAADSAWVDRLAEDITTLASGDAREARMKLNPRLLGDMAVKLEMDGRHTRVHFTVETQQAQQLIADGAQRLTSLVEANGLKLDGATVDLDQRRSGGGDADRRAQTTEQFETQRGTRGGRGSGVAEIVARTRLATATERFA